MEFLGTVYLGSEVGEREYQNVSRGVSVAVTETNSGVMRLDSLTRSTAFAHSNDVQYFVQFGSVKVFIGGKEIQLGASDAFRIRESMEIVF